MRRMFRIILKWLFRFFVGLTSLLVIIILLFFLFNGKITEVALNQINALSPGELKIEKLNLRPFMNFPDVSLQFKNLRYTSGPEASDDHDSIPIIELENVYVSMDIIRLIKGEYRISKIRLSDGVINYCIASDSVSNLERALGMRFDSGADPDTIKSDTMLLSIDLESLTIRNLKMNYKDVPGRASLSLKILGMETGFSYHPDRVSAAVMTHTEISTFTFGEITLDKKRDFSFSSSLNYDQERQLLLLERSMLDLNYTIFGLEGQLDMREETVDMQFSARNSGIELLNFLLSGILDMNAIEQTGEGQITLEGNISGSYAENIPELRVGFKASEMAFKIHTIGQSVSNIGFEGTLSSGIQRDLSEAELRISGFHASFPQGHLDAEIAVANLPAPEISLKIDGETELMMIEEIIDNMPVQNLGGKIRISGDLAGAVDLSNGAYFENRGAVNIFMNDVGFTLSDGHTIDNTNGILYLNKNRFGFHELTTTVDSNEIRLDGWIDHLLPYLMGYRGAISAQLLASADQLFPEKFLGDTLFSEPIRNLSFGLKASSTGDNIEVALKEGAVPTAEIELENLNVKIPGYAEISHINMLLLVDNERINISNLQGNIGESDFRLSGAFENYASYLEKDSAEQIRLEFDMVSERLRAHDLLTIKDRFEILPAGFSTEEILGLKFKGNIETTVYDIMTDNKLPNVVFVCDTLQMSLMHYPHALKNFKIDVALQDSILVVNRFKGTVGESNLEMRAYVAHLFDTSRTFAGQIQIESDLLDLDTLMHYPLLTESANDSDAVPTTDTVSGSFPGFADVDFPDLELKLDLKEIRIAGNTLKSMQGKIDTKPYKIIYFEKFGLQSATGGSMVLDGLFNVSDPGLYMLSANIDIDTVNISDFNIQFVMDDSIYSLEDNFNGVLSTDGIAELFLNPDFSIDLDRSTAIFNVTLADGRVRNFAPLHEIGRFTGNKDLDNVKFGELRSGRSFSLVGGVINIPLMDISSTLGLILIEGEQSLEGDFLYLVRVPPRLIRGTAWNMLSSQQRRESEEEDEIQQMQAQRFAILTVFSNGTDVEVKVGDKRDQFRK
jgi:hypothetical protein